MRLLPCSNPCHRSPTWSALWGMPTSSLRLWCIRLKAWIISSNMVCARCRDCPVSVVNRLLAAHGETGFLTKREASVGTDIPSHRLDPRFVHTFNELQKDGRASYASLGERLGVTHTAIRGRIKKLEDSGVMRIMATVSPMRLGGFRQAFLGLGVKPPYRLDSEQLLAIDEVTYAMSGVGLNGADYLIEIIADNDEDLWRVVDESIRPLPGVEQTWWASTVSVEKESYWLEPPHEGVLLGD